MRNSKVKGFTLVELIVVIAIIAILAAILVPSMLGYIKNSRYTQADANAKNVHTAATAALAQAYVDGSIGAGPANSSVVSFTAATVKSDLTVGSGTVNLSTELGANFKGNGAFCYDNSSFAVISAAWGQNGLENFDGSVPTDDTRRGYTNIVGYYPTPLKES